VFATVTDFITIASFVIKSNLSYCWTVTISLEELFNHSDTVSIFLLSHPFRCSFTHLGRINDSDIKLLKIFDYYHISTFH